ncbi:hypothetical protein QJS10_CPA07g01237 [Acorus calamus]|uniref:Uncharacterized protein n=1 Tax=Acorus calamus TaxID=4465 RepID=A0AAV9EF57_ACOCL|nr:hypothetical protein QJS10_CPA07g01237 [Acorus calamus]
MNIDYGTPTPSPPDLIDGLLSNEIASSTTEAKAEEQLKTDLKLVNAELENSSRNRPKTRRPSMLNGTVGLSRCVHCRDTSSGRL